MDAKNYEFIESLPTGQPITIRAIRPEDSALILEAFPELDQNSLYMRFFRRVSSITDQQLKLLTEVDFICHVALVAVAGINNKTKIVGGGRYIVYDDPSKNRNAEMAFMVHDRYQGQGIATKIMKHLLIIARRNGIAQFEAEVLSGNAGMLAVFSKSGLPMNVSRSDGVLHVTLTL